MTAIVTEHTMPNGAACFYRSMKDDGTEDHSYWRTHDAKGVHGQLTGVTTVVQPFDYIPEGLMRWSADTNAAGIAAIVTDDLDRIPDGVAFVGMTDEQARVIHDVMGSMAWLRDAATIGDRLRAERMTYKDVRDQRAEEGTEVHKHALYALAAGRPVPEYDALSDAARPYVSGVVAFWRDHMPIAELAEQIVCDLELGVAGRPDFIGHIARCGRDGCACKGLRIDNRVIIDAKTSGYIGLKAHAQVAGYDLLAHTCGFGPASDAGFILQVDEIGGYELVPVRADATDFLAAVALYRRAATIRRAADADRRAREKATA